MKDALQQEEKVGFDCRLKGCSSVGVKIEPIAGKGNALCAQRDFTKGECLLLAPCEHIVAIPMVEEKWLEHRDVPARASESIGNLRSASAVEAAASARRRDCRRRILQHDFVELKVLHGEHVDLVFTVTVYWAALMSLVEEEGPGGLRWPAVSASTQQRLLSLYRPQPLLSHRSDQQYGSLAPRVCRHFGLSVAPEKLVELLKVWKYNGFGQDSATGAQLCTMELAICHVNHSCEPNCFVRRHLYHSAEIIAKQSLKEGDEVTIDYLTQGYDEFKSQTKVRRQLLALTWLFFCTCTKCSSVNAPTCPYCSCEMTPVVSKVQEQIYPGFAVNCHACRRTDLQGELGYFFHCSTCSVDLCQYME